MAEIFTINGMIEESLLEKRVGELDNDVEHTTWVEWYLDGELVKRSAHVTLKKSPHVEAGISGFC